MTEPRILFGSAHVCRRPLRLVPLPISDCVLRRSATRRSLACATSFTSESCSWTSAVASRMKASHISKVFARPPPLTGAGLWAYPWSARLPLPASDTAPPLQV